MCVFSSSGAARRFRCKKAHTFEDLEKVIETMEQKDRRLLLSSDNALAGLPQIVVCRGGLKIRKGNKSPMSPVIMLGW